MSPEYVRLEKILHNISDKVDYPPIDVQWMEDTRNSEGEYTAMVLYINFNNEQWEYHHFKIPNRETRIASILVDTFCFYMI